MRKASRIFLNFAAILGVWFLFAAGLTLVPGITNSVLVPFPSKALVDNLPDDVSIMRWSNGLAILYSERQGFVADIYKSGAMFVLPSRKAGCLDLRERAA
jgi:hypothetical protein